MWFEDTIRDKIDELTKDLNRPLICENKRARLFELALRTETKAKKDILLWALDEYKKGKVIDEPIEEE